MLHAHERLREDRAAKTEDAQLRATTAAAEEELKEAEAKVLIQSNIICSELFKLSLREVCN